MATPSDSGEAQALSNQVDTLSVIFERRNQLIDRRRWKAYHDAGGKYLANVQAERAEENALIQELEGELVVLDKLLQEAVSGTAEETDR